MMCDLGTKVTIIEAAPNILLSTDRDCRKVVDAVFKKRDRHPHRRHGHRPGNDRCRCHRRVRRGSKVTAETWSCPSAAARSPTLGLEQHRCAVDERGFIVGDEICRTAYPVCTPSVTSSTPPNLAHIGSPKGMRASTTSLARRVPVDYDTVPWCIYCHPEVAFAGLTEEQAQERGIETVVSQAPLSRQRPGDDRRRDRRSREDRGREEGRWHRWHHHRGSHGWSLGHRATRAGLPGRELGSHCSMRPPASSNPIRPCARLFGETVMSLTGRSLH